MENTRKLLESFYAAFDRKDHAAMRACYAPKAQFSDPGFPKLEGDSIGDMWEMLCTSAKELAITCEVLEASSDSGHVRWQATYTFSRTGRQVVNIITATFKIKDGLITHHKDTFDFWLWSRMALGPVGVALGWTRFLQLKVQAQAAGQLQKFQEKKKGRAKG